MQTLIENNDIRFKAAGNLAFLLSVIRCGETLSEDEEANVRAIIDELAADYAATAGNERRNEAIREIVTCAQGVLTALNVGDVQSESPLHLKLREVMIAHRDKAREGL